jgi:xylulokinase
VVFAATPVYRPEPAGRLHAFCHAAAGTWHYMGVMLSAGGSLRWYRDVLGEPERAAAAATGADPYDVMLDDAARAPAGSDGLIFLPYLSGERTPHADPNARGVFFGLSSRHTKPHLTRAVVEGITFGLRDSLELLRDLGVSNSQVRVSGGGARSALWRQILADVFGVRVVTTNVTQGAAFGAALLAGVGAGVFPDVATAANRVVRLTSQADPGPAATVYTALYPRYRALYHALAGEFGVLAALDL